jgi:hypothetical protein
MKYEKFSGLSSFFLFVHTVLEVNFATKFLNRAVLQGGNLGMELHYELR